MPATSGTRNHIQREHNKFKQNDAWTPRNQNITLPDEIKCVDCSRIQEPSEYSEKQLSILREKIRKLGLDTVKDGQFIRCIMCGPKVSVELECTMCFTTKRIDDFAKIQRKDRETATCKECMLEKLAIDPVRNPDSSYMKSLGMTAEEANTSTWTVPLASAPLPASITPAQSRPVPAYTTRVERWGKKSDIPLKEEPITTNSSLAGVSDADVPTKLPVPSLPDKMTTPAKKVLPVMPVKSFASAAAAAPRTDMRDKDAIVPARSQATTSAWGQQAAPSTPAAAVSQSLKLATTKAIPVTSHEIKQEPYETATTTGCGPSTTETQWESANTTHKWDMPETASWETFGTQIEDSVTNDSDACSLKFTPVSTASYAQSIASTNTEPCSPMSPADVTTDFGRMTMNSPQPQVVYSAEEWNKIAEQGRNARCGRYYGQPGGRGSGGKRGGW